MAFAVRYQVKLLHKNQIANSSTMESFVPNVSVQMPSGNTTGGFYFIIHSKITNIYFVYIHIITIFAM